MVRNQILKLYVWYLHMPTSKKLILVSFLVWVLQAIPKWGFVIFGDGEMAAEIMTAFITPRSDL